MSTDNGIDPAKLPRCPCAMYQSKGTCFHTGHKPTFREPPAEPPPVPRAIKRMHAWNELTKGKAWP